jgi:HEAT repeat protein
VVKSYLQLQIVQLACLVLGLAAIDTLAQDKSLTPLQARIQQQQRRLSSADEEERRGAVMQLGLLHHPDASRLAVPLLNDPSVAVRVAAVNSVLGLPAHESVVALIPLLKDKNEFVRQETAYALGKTGSRAAVGPLLDLISVEKLAGPKGAAIVSLGRLGDESAVVALAGLVAPNASAPKGSRRTVETNEFVLRSAVRALGQIGNRAAVPALTFALTNDKYHIEVRREAAVALGLIGDPGTKSVLSDATNSDDPYLSRAAYEALRRLDSFGVRR